MTRADKLVILKELGKVVWDVFGITRFGQGFIRFFQNGFIHLESIIKLYYIPVMGFEYLIIWTVKNVLNNIVRTFAGYLDGMFETGSPECTKKVLSMLSLCINQGCDINEVRSLKYAP